MKLFIAEQREIESTNENIQAKFRRRWLLVFTWNQRSFFDNFSIDAVLRHICDLIDFVNPRIEQVN
jgi:hypothetical protein